jgi:hypothetical protein
MPAFKRLTFLSPTALHGYEAREGCAVNLDLVTRADRFEVAARGPCTKLWFTDGTTQLVVGDPDTVLAQPAGSCRSGKAILTESVPPPDMVPVNTGPLMNPRMRTDLDRSDKDAL